MHGGKKFANRNPLKLQGFSKLSTGLLHVLRAFIAGIVACVIFTAAFNYMLGLWFMALLLVCVAGVFSWALRLTFTAWGR